MDENGSRRVELLKTFFNVKKDKDLGALLDVSSGMVSQWKQKGFSKSYSNLFDAVFNAMSCCEIRRRSGASFCTVCGKAIKSEKRKL